MKVDIATARTMIGYQVRKKSGKPFKSTLKVATIKGAGLSHRPGRATEVVFLFCEDDSVVECKQVEMVL